jgi:hypothetical protein
VGDVVVALHGEVLDVPQQSHSAAAEVWQEAARSLGQFLDSVDLETIAARQRELDASAAPMYYI